MKVIAALTLVGAATAFAPQEVGRPSTAQNALFDRVSFSVMMPFVTLAMFQIANVSLFSLYRSSAWIFSSPIRTKTTMVPAARRM
jgi:hypothetical protein